MGMGREQVKELREVGQWLAYLKEPEPPKGFKDALDKLPVFKQVLNMPVKRLRKAACQEVVWQGEEVDLDKIPVMSCWQDDVAPLLTWGLTITRGPNKKRQIWESTVNRNREKQNHHALASTPRWGFGSA